MNPADMTPEALTAAILTAEAALKPLHDERTRRMLAREATIEERVKRGPWFADADLRYSAGARCVCGAGLAYPKDVGMHGEWMCSAYLKGALPAVDADPFTGKHVALPFAMYEVKSEGQPSAAGATTRPAAAPGAAP